MSQTSEAVTQSRDEPSHETPRFEVCGAAREVVRRVKDELLDHFPDPDGSRAEDIAQMVERFASANRPAGILLSITANTAQHASEEIDLIAAQLEDKPHPVMLDAGSQGKAPRHYENGKALQADKEQVLRLSDAQGGELLVSICAIDGVDKASQIDLILCRLHVIMGQLTNIDRTGVLQVLGDQRAKLSGLVRGAQQHGQKLTKLLEELKARPDALDTKAVAQALNGLQQNLKDIVRIPGLPQRERGLVTAMMKQLQALPTTFPVLSPAFPLLNNKLFPQAAIQQQTVQRAEVKVEAKTAANPAPVANAQKIMAAAKNDNQPKADTGTKAENTQRRFSVVAKPVSAERLAERIQQPDTKAPAQAAPSLRVVGGNPDAPRTAAPEARKAFTVVGRDAGERVMQTLAAKAAEPAKTSGPVAKNATAPIALDTKETTAATTTTTAKIATTASAGVQASQQATPSGQPAGPPAVPNTQALNTVIQAGKVDASITAAIDTKGQTSTVTSATEIRGAEVSTSVLQTEARAVQQVSVNGAEFTQAEPKATVAPSTVQPAPQAAEIQQAPITPDAAKVMAAAGNENAPLAQGAANLSAPVAQMEAQPAQQTATLVTVQVKEAQPATALHTTSIQVTPTAVEPAPQQPAAPSVAPIQPVLQQPSEVTPPVVAPVTVAVAEVPKAVDPSVTPIQAVPTVAESIAPVQQPVAPVVEAKADLASQPAQPATPITDKLSDPVAPPADQPVHPAQPPVERPSDPTTLPTRPPIETDFKDCGCGLCAEKKIASAAQVEVSRADTFDLAAMAGGVEQTAASATNSGITPPPKPPIETDFKDCGCGLCAEKKIASTAQVEVRRADTLDLAAMAGGVEQTAASAIRNDPPVQPPQSPKLAA